MFPYSVHATCRVTQWRSKTQSISHHFSYYELRRHQHVHLATFFEPIRYRISNIITRITWSDEPSLSGLPALENRGPSTRTWFCTVIVKSSTVTKTWIVLNNSARSVHNRSVWRQVVEMSVICEGHVTWWWWWSDAGGGGGGSGGGGGGDGGGDQSINQSINQFISRHSTEARATVRLCRIKENCLETNLKCVNGWSSSTVQ